MPRSVQETVWNWRAGFDRENSRRTATSLRRQSVIQAVMMGAIGFFLYRFAGQALFARIIWGFAGLVLTLGLASPSAYLPIHRFGQKLSLAVGQLLTFILLIPLYFVVFLPGAIILKLARRDPLQRRKRDGKYTCWIQRRSSASSDSYRRQFLLEDEMARGALRLVDTEVDPHGGHESRGDG